MMMISLRPKHLNDHAVINIQSGSTPRVFRTNHIKHQEVQTAPDEEPSKQKDDSNFSSVCSLHRLYYIIK